MEVEHYLYFVSSFGRVPLIKVGITWNIGVRLQALSRSSKRKLKLLGSVSLPNEAAARKAEKYFLNYFYKYRLNHRSEWMNRAPEILDYINQKTIKPTGRVIFK